MRKTKRLAAFFLPLLLVSFLQAQSLADLAKKEKERRAAIKGKPAATITTADVAKVKKRPAVETVTSARAGEEAAVAEAEGAVATEEGAAPPATTQTAEAAQGAAAPPGQATPAETPPAKPAAAPAETAKSIEARTAELTKAAEDKQQLVDLLTLKMNALYQEFYSLDNMKSREMIQAQISDTYDKLLKAEVESKQAAKDLQDFLNQSKKAGGSSIWFH